MRRFPQRIPFLLEVSRQNQTSASVVIFAKPGILSRPSPPPPETTDPFAAPPHETSCRGAQHWIHHTFVVSTVKLATPSTRTNQAPFLARKKGASHHQDTHRLLHFCNTTHCRGLAYLIHGPRASHYTIRGALGQKTPSEHGQPHDPALVFFARSAILHAFSAAREAQTGYSTTAGMGARVQVVEKTPERARSRLADKEIELIIRAALWQNQFRPRSH